MAMKTHAAKVTAAKKFVQRWQGRGQEKSDTHTFWLDLCDSVIGMEHVATTVLFESQTTDRGWVDAVIPDAKTFIEQKSLGVDLDKPETRQGLSVTPFEQAKRYADSQRNSQRPDTIIISNFETFRIHDLDQEKPAENYTEFSLDELPDQLHLLDFLVDPQIQRARREKSVSLTAGQLIGKLYGMLAKQYQDPDSDQSQHSLNVLLVRIVFCLYAEDAGVFEKNAFYNYLAGIQPRMARYALDNLFKNLDTPVADRDPYEAEEFAAFPYVNGGLFRDRHAEIPHFTAEILDVLLTEVSAGTDWSQISPTVFGGVFESTLNPETRHSGGMHYTSPENIHRVIDPLFLDALTDELEDILNEQGVGAIKRRNNLKRYQDKLASLRFFDPACGSGNFLTETYISLRRLENTVLSELARHQTSLVFEDVEESPVKVNVNQFYGIEINDFAVSVGQTALWIAKLQADLETEILTSGRVNILPLLDSPNIVQGNALQTDWTEALDPAECDYVIGNPPFLGSKMQSTEQKADLRQAFEEIGATRNLGTIDYVAGWYAKATAYMGDHAVRTAFVSTNSVSQGEQVANIWHPIWEHGVRIDFAHDTFRWANESTDPAAVFVVIIGFSKLGGPKQLFHYEDINGEPEIMHPKMINAYLRDAPDVFIWNRSKPLSDVPKVGIGNKPIDDGNYLFTAEEKNEFLEKEPQAEAYFHRWYGAQEFIKGIERWVLWLGDASPADLQRMPLALDRVRAVKEYRESRTSAPTRKLAETPTRFHVENMPEGDSILIPKVSSERRRYIPLGLVEPESLCSDLVFILPNATRFHFGVMHSRTHNAWMRTVAGRLKSDYRYSAGLVYNNFIWPEVNVVQEQEISALGQAVLDARQHYPDATIAQMYNPDNDWLYPELTKAHEELDAAVERAYGLEPGCEEKEIVELLFELYNSAINSAT